MRKQTSTKSRAWILVQLETKRLPVPQIEPLYAIPISVLNELRRQCRHLLGPKEWDFEFSISTHGGGG